MAQGLLAAAQAALSRAMEDEAARVVPRPLCSTALSAFAVDSNPRRY